MMQSLALLEELRQLPAGDEDAGYSHSSAASQLRGMDKDFFALDVAQATEAALEALFESRNVPDVLEQAYRAVFTDVSSSKSLHESFMEKVASGDMSVLGFVNKLKGTVAEIESVPLFEGEFPGYKFELSSSPIQQGYDLIGRGPEGAEDVLIQVKAGGLGYASKVMQRMEDTPANIDFALTVELYEKVSENMPEAFDRLINTGIENSELTETVEDGLGKLAGNMGIDVPDSIGEALPYVGEVVLAIRLISQIVSAEGEFTGVEVSERSRVHAIRALTMMTRFGVTQVCAMAGGAAGTAVSPGVGSAVGSIGGAGAAILLNRLLEPRIEEVAITIMGGDREEVFYLMNKPAIDEIGSSLAATLVA